MCELGHEVVVANVRKLRAICDNPRLVRGTAKAAGAHLPLGPSRRRPLPAEHQHVNLSAASVDLGAGAHFVAVPPGRDPQGQDMHQLGAFAADLYALADWLAACRVHMVTMESTGVYWIPLFEVLEERSFDLKLVNPAT